VTPARFDELIHSPTRLAIVSLLAAVEWADFKVIRDQVGLYVQIRKTFIGKRPRTSARLTAAGLAAFKQHVAALQQIVQQAGVTVLPG